MCVHQKILRNGYSALALWTCFDDQVELSQYMTSACSGDPEVEICTTYAIVSNPIEIRSMALGGIYYACCLGYKKDESIEGVLPAHSWYCKAVSSWKRYNDQRPVVPKEKVYAVVAQTPMLRSKVRRVIARSSPP
jgi:hypothetical protein